MTVHLYVAPAASGKTEYCLQLARQAASGLAQTPRVCPATRLQEMQWRERLAERAGALGIRLLPFDLLCRDCLSAAGETVVRLDPAVQFRLIRSVLSDVPLGHYGAIRSRAGFAQEIQELIHELHGALVGPELLGEAVERLGGDAALRDLAGIYSAYEDRVRVSGYIESSGLVRRAIRALERLPGLARDWPLLIVDGFDRFVPAQLRLLQLLASRVHELVVTVTDTPSGGASYPRFRRARAELQDALGVAAEALPLAPQIGASTLNHVQGALFQPRARQAAGDASVALIEAPDRAGEVRAALRWLKERLVRDGMRPDDVALLARSILPYRAVIVQTAAEFGLPIRLVGGLPLGGNPAVSALLRLLELSLPGHGPTGEPALSRRSLVETWRSPYFDWSARADPADQEAIGVTAEDAAALDAVSRWARVTGGLGQWTEALARLAGRSADSGDDDEQGLAPGLPVGPHALALKRKLERFVRRITPPAGLRTGSEFVAWLEDLIGPDPFSDGPCVEGNTGDPEPATSLRMVKRVREGPAGEAERDLAGLRELKLLLRALMWADEIIEPGARRDYASFLADLIELVGASGYRMPDDELSGPEGAILVADAPEARGLRFRDVALIGLAEAEFPRVVREDPFLRDDQRGRLRGDGLALEDRAESAEREYFYGAVSRASEKLLLTRPRLTEEGAVWQPSPFWDTVRRLAAITPHTLVGDRAVPPAEAASWPELLESLASHSGFDAIRQAPAVAVRRRTVLSGSVMLQARSRSRSDDPHDGYLAELAEPGRFDPHGNWSATRLETYLACPFRYWVENVLGLEARGEPDEGLDARQLGTIYHRIFERVYRGASDLRDLAALLDALPAVAQSVLDEAPAREGFRVTAWWQHTRDEIVEIARCSLEQLHLMCADAFTPRHFELRFGGPTALVLRDGEDEFRLCGVIDRIDVGPSGELRVIDYKTAGSSAFTERALREGKKVQIALYALAARDGLRLGEPVDAFYWHIKEAKASPFRLSACAGGPDTAFFRAVEAAWGAVRAVRAGQFVPRVPDSGCPAYCAAAGFCWHYRPGFGEG